MRTHRGQNGSTHGRESLAAKRERYESDLAAASQTKPETHNTGKPRRGAMGDRAKEN